MGAIVNYIETVTNANTWSKKFDRNSKIIFVHVDYTSDATVGNRQLRLSLINNSGTLVFDAHAGAVQAASLNYHYSFSQGVFRETSFVDSQIQSPIPMGIMIPAGYTLQIADSADVAATDDFVISYQVEEGIG